MEVGSCIRLSRGEIDTLGLDFKRLKDDLTLPNPEYQNIRRFGKGHFYKKVEPNICYLKESGGIYTIPRFYVSEDMLPMDGDVKLNEGKKLSTDEVALSLRSYQREFFDVNKELLKHSGVLLEAACGSGKTIMALYISHLRNRRTMVLVPTYYLAGQWQQRIAEFMPKAKVTLLTVKDKFIPLDSDFYIVCMDLFSVRVLPDELVESIGHVVLDEAHRVGAETYLPILEEIPAKYRTALTATFRRSDGVHKILAYHFGAHFKMESRFPRPKLYTFHTGVKVGNVISKNKKYEGFLKFLDLAGIPYNETKSVIELSIKSPDELRNTLQKMYAQHKLKSVEVAEARSCIYRGSEKMSYTTVESYLSEHCGRRKTIISLIRKCLESGRTVLFLSKRKEVLKTLAKCLSDYSPMVIISETNKRTPEEDEYLQKKCRLILGVTQLAKEGLDIDRLDTLILHLPMKDTEQAIGRISRLCDGKKEPTCFYLVDDSPMTYAVFNNAKKFISINSDYAGKVVLKDVDAVL